MSNEEIIKEIRWQIAAQVELEKAADGLDEEEYDRALQRAICYRDVEHRDAEIFLQEAINIAEEVRVQFANSIADQVSRAEMILADVAGISDPEEIPPVEEVVRFINNEFPDPTEANRLVDDMAIKIGQTVAELKG